jgi:hypothetical protein
MLKAMLITKINSNKPTIAHSPAPTRKNILPSTGSIPQMALDPKREGSQYAV